MTGRDSSRRLVSPVWLVLIGILSVQFGAGIAKSLFDEISPTSIVWLRLVTSAVVLVAIARPALRGRSRSDWLVVLAFGACLGVMNWAIYQAFARIPLGMAVTLEFIGPLTLAVIGSRRVRDLLWVLLAGLGVAVLGLEGGSDVNLAGVLFALLAGAMWASYILLAGQTGRRWPGFDGLALASVVATVLLTPFAIGEGGGDLLDPRDPAARRRRRAAVVGGARTRCELVALRSIKASVFSILMSLEPAAAALAGIIVLQEFLTWEQWLAMTFVVIASVGATRSARTLAPAPGLGRDRRIRGRRSLWSRGRFPATGRLDGHLGSTAVVTAPDMSSESSDSAGG